MSNIPTNTAETGEIEFQCEKCHYRLRVPGRAVGKRAQCPNCSHVQTVPGAESPRTASAQVANQDTTSYPHLYPTTASSPPIPPNYGSQMAGSPMFNSSPLQPPARNAPPQLAPLGSPMLGGSPLASTSGPMFDAGAIAASGLSTATNPNSPLGSPLAKSQAVSAAGQPTLQRSAERKHEGQDTETRRLYQRICEEVAKVYVGQEELILGTLVALFSSGHVLIESVPGLGKTLFVRTLGRVLGCDFGRIQFTADLMPSDVTGAPIFSMKTQEFEFRPGPVFTQLLLADEINRSPAKTHAALLEIMQEYHVTVDGKTHTLQKPFLVMATQNPIESEGTYNLPEAQLDRFMFKLFVDYPSEQEEARILDLHSRQVDLDRQLEQDLKTVTSPGEIIHITQQNAQVQVVPALAHYINRLVRMTRQWPLFHMGASPRAGIALMQGARTLAAFSGRDYAIPDDVAEIALPALRHRVILTAEAEVEGQTVDAILLDMIRSVEVPRI